MAIPKIKSAQKRKEYSSPSHQAVLLDHIKVQGSVQYEFLIAVFKPGAVNPFFIISSEKSNPMASFDLMEFLGEEEDEDENPTVIPAPTYFFCYSDEHGHFNMGSSPDWANLQKFEQRALALLQEKLGEVFEQA